MAAKEQRAADALQAAKGCAIGVDVGGTKIAAGVVTFPDGQLRARRRIQTGASRGGDAVLGDVLRLVKELSGEARKLNLHPVAIGAGVCELVSPGGRVLSANCIDWLKVPVRERLSAIAPARIEADVRAAALAEARFGAGREFNSFLYVTVGTGISSCLVLEGRPFAGARGATGTMASSAWSFACEKCGHADERSLEEIASGPALVARYQARGGRAATAEAVVAAAVGGDKAAKDVATSAAAALGQTVGWLINTLDPEAVIVGGGLGLSGGMYWESFVAATRRHIWSDAHRRLSILRAETGSDAGIIGAAVSAWLSLRAVDSSEGAACA